MPHNFLLQATQLFLSMDDQKCDNPWGFMLINSYKCSLGKTTLKNKLYKSIIWIKYLFLSNQSNLFIQYFFINYQNTSYMEWVEEFNLVSILNL